MLRFDVSKYIAELAGSFIFTFFGLMAIATQIASPNSLANLIASLVWGSSMAICILSFGNISGAHFNPVVTIGLIIHKKLPATELFPYIVSQLAGAISASILVKSVFPKISNLGMTIPKTSLLSSLFLETIFTMILMLIILRSISGFKLTGTNSALTVGATIFVLNIVGSNLTGASMNPARSLGSSVISYDLQYIWLYCLGPLTGVIFALLINKIIVKK